MSHNLNSLKQVIKGTSIGGIKGDTGRLDHGSVVSLEDRPVAVAEHPPGFS